MAGWCAYGGGESKRRPSASKAKSKGMRNQYFVRWMDAGRYTLHTCELTTRARSSSRKVGWRHGKERESLRDAKDSSNRLHLELLMKYL